MIGVYLYDIFGASAGNKSSHPKDESNSITNQRNLIMEYIKSDAVLSTYTVREYIDDGISGTRFDREAFEEMMTQVKEGNIQVIITKDYSRLGRDYLEVGRYLEFVFPVLKVRYISVNDNYDSNNFTGATGGMEVAVKNVINMMYSRDASKKVRSARTTLAKAGKFIGPRLHMVIRGLKVINKSSLLMKNLQRWSDLYLRWLSMGKNISKLPDI